MSTPESNIEVNSWMLLVTQIKHLTTFTLWINGDGMVAHVIIQVTCTVACPSMSRDLETWKTQGKHIVHSWNLTCFNLKNKLFQDSHSLYQIP